MTDFIVDAANFRTLARMSDSSGLQLLQALIDEGNKIVITDAVEAEIVNRPGFAGGSNF